MAGSPLKNLFPAGLCQGTNRRGLPCGVRLEVRRCKNGRLLCKWHGGWSTGPRTPEGKVRCGEAGRRNLKAWHTRRRGATANPAPDGVAESGGAYPGATHGPG